MFIVLLLINKYLRTIIIAITIYKVYRIIFNKTFLAHNLLISAKILLSPAIYKLQELKYKLIKF